MTDLNTARMSDGIDEKGEVSHPSSENGAITTLRDPDAHLSPEERADIVS